MLPRGPVVLLVDDQPIVGAAVRKMLAAEQDITFHFCESAEGALAMAEAIEPTTILQDLVMPRTDGYTMLQRYRENTATSDIPVIVLSSREDPRDKSEAFAKGASDYLVKLPDKIELIARIRAHSHSFLAQRQRDAAFKALELARAELEEKNAILERMSAIDGLTGIANRRRFDEALAAEWKRSRRDKSELGLILIDVDFFKRFNDTYGHLAGDDCLRKVAQSLAAVVRRPADLAARYGGEEFVVLLPQTDAEGVATVADGMREAVEALALAHASSDVEKHVTISLGSARARPETDDTAGTQALIERADKALYAAKRAGRNRHHSD
ncbi:MAG TPA: diguanylate cyclase [Kofleriaceae bacterium]|jgi:two-component system chemotaxis family response regulator WspR